MKTYERISETRAEAIYNVLLGFTEPPTPRDLSIEVNRKCGGYTPASTIHYWASKHALGQSAVSGGLLAREIGKRVPFWWQEGMPIASNRRKTPGESVTIRKTGIDPKFDEVVDAAQETLRDLGAGLSPRKQLRILRLRDHFSYISGTMQLHANRMKQHEAALEDSNKQLEEYRQLALASFTLTKGRKKR